MDAHCVSLNGDLEMLFIPSLSGNHAFTPQQPDIVLRPFLFQMVSTKISIGDKGPCIKRSIAGRQLMPQTFVKEHTDQPGQCYHLPY